MSETTEMMAAETAESGNEGFDDMIENAWQDDGAPAQQETPAPQAPDQPDRQQPACAPAGAEELFTLKNRDERRQVTRDQLIAMAQKGWDYDTVRAERDQLRQYRQQSDPTLKMVQANARQNGMTVPEYLDFCRKQDLMRTGLDEQSAARTIQMEKQKASLDERQARLDEQTRRGNELLQRARLRQAQQRQDMQRFVQTYPDVKAEAIPRQVWAQVARGVPLVSAYAMHENQQLKAELAAERQNRANRLRTPGALSANSGPEPDELDRVWAEDD